MVDLPPSYLNILFVFLTLSLRLNAKSTRKLDVITRNVNGAKTVVSEGSKEASPPQGLEFLRAPEILVIL